MYTLEGYCIGFHINVCKLVHYFLSSVSNQFFNYLLMHLAFCLEKEMTVDTQKIIAHPENKFTLLLHRSA